MFQYIQQYINNFKHSTVAVIEVRDSYICCYVFKLLNHYSDYLFQGSWHVSSNGFKAGEIDNVNIAVDSMAKLLNVVETALKFRIQKVIWHIPYQFLLIDTKMYNEVLKHKITAKDLSALKKTGSYQDKIPKKYFILDINFSNYYVDNTEYDYPINLYAKNLSIYADLIMVEKGYIQTIYKLLDFFSLEMTFASNLLLYLPYLFYNNVSKMSAFIDVNQDSSELLVTDNNHVVFHYQIGYGIRSILIDTYKSLGIDTETLQNINIESDSFFQLTGKTTQLVGNDSGRNIIYDDFYKALEKVITGFIFQINKVLSDNDYKDIKSLTFIGDCGSLLMNDILSKHILNNNNLQQIIKMEDKKSNKSVAVGDIASISLIKFILNSKSNVSKLSKFNHNVEELIMGNQN